MKRFLCLIFIGFNLLTFAASVKWNAFDVCYQGGEGNIRGYGIDKKVAEADCAVIFLDSVLTGSGIRVSSCPAFPETCCAWILVTLGTVIDEDYFKRQDSYFFRYGLYGDVNEHHDYELEFNAGENVYLAVMTTFYDTPSEGFNYGWLELGLTADGTLYAVNSALGLDGQSMVVGGDSAIPEPSCVLLLLLGLGVFGLCRKRMGV